MKKIIIGIVICVFIIIGCGLAYGGNYLYELGLDPSVSKDMIFESESCDSEADETSGSTTEEDKSWLLNESDYNDLWITSDDGLDLHNYEILNEESNTYVIAVHGYTSEGLLMSSYAKNFYDMGYNVILPDLRGHGASEGDYIGMGWDDRLDIVNLINYIVEKDAEAEIILFGVSMGAATVMMTSGEELPSNVKAVIEDCGYTSAWDEFAYQLKALFNLSSFPMMNIANLINNINNDYDLKEASAVEQVSKSNTPTLFIHGDTDDFVPTNMVNELFEACSAEKEMLIISGAGHAKASTTDAELYWNSINEFIKEHLTN